MLFLQSENRKSLKLKIYEVKVERYLIVGNNYQSRGGKIIYLFIYLLRHKMYIHVIGEKILKIKTSTNIKIYTTA